MGGNDASDDDDDDDENGKTCFPFTNRKIYKNDR